MQKLLHIDELADELKLHIATFLDYSSLKNLSKVNKKWHSFLADRSLWQKMLAMESQYQCDSNENIRDIFFRLKWLKSLPDAQLAKHYIGTAIKKALIAIGTYKTVNLSKIQPPSVLDIKLLIHTQSLLENLTNIVAVYYDYLTSDSMCIRINDLFEIYLKNSKELRKYFWDKKLIKPFNVTFGIFYEDYLESCNTTSCEYDYLFSSNLVNAIEILQEHEIDIYSDCLNIEITNLYKTSPLFKQKLTQKIGCLNALCYSNPLLAKYLINDIDQRNSLTLLEICNIGAKHPEIGHQLLTDPDLKKLLPSDDLKFSKPILPSRIAGAIVGGLLGGLFTPLIYLFRTCGWCHDKSSKLFIFLNILILPSVLYGLIRGAHAGATLGFFGGINIVDTLMLQDQYATYPNWHKRYYRTTTVADCAAKYVLDPNTSSSTETTPLLTKNNALS